MIREIALDTETTGMDPEEGHRIVEIGCVELHNHLPTGRNFHIYLNPEREVPPEATAIHGLNAAFLKKQKTFSETFTEFLDFLGDQSQLIIHNAAFDMKFINAELRKVGHPGIKQNRVVDSLEIARRKFPGSPANLDALCRRFEIDLSERELHGALLDAQLLGDVWLELMGGRQHDLAIENKPATNSSQAVIAQHTPREPRPHEISEEELTAHTLLLDKLKAPLWSKYLD